MEGPSQRRSPAGPHLQRRTMSFCFTSRLGVLRGILLEIARPSSWLTGCFASKWPRISARRRQQEEKGTLGHTADVLVQHLLLRAPSRKRFREPHFDASFTVTFSW